MLNATHSTCLLPCPSLQACCAWLTGLLACRVVQIGCAVAYYVLNAIYISQRIGTRLDKNHVPWPDWGWFFVVGAGALWLVSAILALSESLTILMILGWACVSMFPLVWVACSRCCSLGCCVHAGQAAGCLASSREVCSPTCIPIQLTQTCLACHPQQRGAQSRAISVSSTKY